MPQFNSLLKNKNLQAGSIWIILIAGLEVLYRSNILNKAFIAAPSQVLDVFTKQSFWQILALDFSETLSRLVIGLVIGLVTAQILTIITTFSPTLFRFFSQFSLVLKYLPLPVLIPFSILIFGISELSVILVISVTTFVIYFDYIITTINKEESKYKILQSSWNISAITRYKNFVFPITNKLNFRIISSLIIWLLGIAIISEIILGLKYGFGTRLQQFQQLYKPDLIIAYTIVILGLSYFLERILINYFARFAMDLWKKLSLVIMVLIISLSFGYTGFKIYRSSNNTKDFTQTITTYKASVNLPIFVMAEKFNSLDYQLNLVADGIQSVNAISAKSSVVSGYADMPNVLGAIAKNSNLKIISQSVEQPSNPILFLISKKIKVGDTNLSVLNKSKIGYFPNNPLIKAGLDLSLFSQKVNTSGIEYIGGNDPNILVQSYNNNQLDALLLPEPFITDIEQKQDVKRFNVKQSLIKQISFTNLPLAGMIIDTKNTSAEDQKKFITDIAKSIDYIEKHSQGGIADDELGAIMSKYDLNPKSQIPTTQALSKINLPDLNQIIQLTQLYDPVNGQDLAKLTSESVYYK